MEQPGVELATYRSPVRRPNHYTTELSLACKMFYVHRIALPLCVSIADVYRTFGQSINVINILQASASPQNV